MKKKFLLATFLSSLLVFSFLGTKPAYAGWPWDLLNIEQHIVGWTRSIITTIAQIPLEDLSGRDIDELHAAAELAVKGEIPYSAVVAKNSLAALPGNLADAIYKNPANVHLAPYIRYRLADNIFGAPVFASNKEDTLSPISDAWRKLRNISYLFLTLAALGAGFLIMFRKEVAPRVRVTLMSALPRLAIGVLLITFSYAIVSGAMDLSFLLVGLIRTLIPAYDLPELFRDTLGGIIAGAIVGVINLFTTVNPIILLIAAVIGIIALLILGYFVWKIVKVYIKFLFLGLFGPLIITVGSFPGQEKRITDWFKNLGACVLTFPAVSATLALSNMLRSTKGGWITEAIMWVVSIVIIWYAAKVPDAIDKALGAGPLFGFGGGKK